MVILFSRDIILTTRVSIYRYVLLSLARGTNTLGYHQNVYIMTCTAHVGIVVITNIINVGKLMKKINSSS